MTDPVQLPAQERVYGSFASMLRKYDRYARQDAFRGLSLIHISEPTRH